MRKWNCIRNLRKKLLERCARLADFDASEPAAGSASDAEVSDDQLSKHELSAPDLSNKALSHKDDSSSSELDSDYTDEGVPRGLTSLRRRMPALGSLGLGIT